MNKTDYAAKDSGMKKYIVGYTGFVGSNLIKMLDFTGFFNSSNIAEAYGKKPELLVYSGVKAEKFHANNNPEEDAEHVDQAFTNIVKIDPKKLVLISTIDVYGNNPYDKDEESDLSSIMQSPYGYHRLQLEKRIQENFSSYHIIRLPALYGDNLKKNYIYDFINVIPSKLAPDLFMQLNKKNHFIDKYYKLQNNGYYNYIKPDKNDETKLKEYFKNVGFSALNFTDSRNTYQFYNLSYMKEHLNYIFEHDLRIINLVTEPVRISELQKFLTGKEYQNEFLKGPLTYNITSIHAINMSGRPNYLFSKDFIFKDIYNFVHERMYKGIIK
ncbi:MAG: NAD(P)-dependent oxidoreductase [Vallitaleaceae bacterium]|nr:NAD(P)-dependent oxidoreductase [Vallitaleaceae bacterium]